MLSEGPPNSCDCSVNKSKVILNQLISPLYCINSVCVLILLTTTCSINGVHVVIAPRGEQGQNVRRDHFIQAWNGFACLRGNKKTSLVRISWWTGYRDTSGRHAEEWLLITSHSIGQVQLITSSGSDWQEYSCKSSSWSVAWWTYNWPAKSLLTWCKLNIRIINKLLTEYKNYKQAPYWI